MSRTYLERYRAGEYEQVWAELVALGPAVRDEPFSMQAHAVAQEMMRRALHNVGLIVPRLHTLGFRFVGDLPAYRYDPVADLQKTLQQAKKQADDPLSAVMFGVLEQRPDLIMRHFADIGDDFQWLAEQVRAELDPHGAALEPSPPIPIAYNPDPGWQLPNEELQTRINDVEQKYGPLPLVVQTWFEIVGEVDFCGVHPKLSRYVLRAPDEQQGPDSDPMVF